MFRSATRQGLFVLIVLAVRLSAQDTDSVYTHVIKAPDFLVPSIEPLLKPGSAGLFLTGWTAGLVPADTIVEQDDTAPPELGLSVRRAAQVVQRFPDMLKPKLTSRKRVVKVEPQSRIISVSLEHDRTRISLPSTTSLDWYIANRLDDHMRTLTQAKLAAAIQSSSRPAPVATFARELLGADIGGQRVSLRVAGNVTINGSVKFKEQEKSATNFRAGSNWDLDVKQTQRFDITGSVGDRVDVTIHQDSENIFEWENAMKIAYKGDEDEILQTVDAGNISLSLPGTQFATGGSGGSKGLFGIKALSKLGPVDITTIASIERSQKSTKSNRFGEGLVMQDRLFLRNKYFFIDTEFRAGYYPLTSDGRHVYNGNRIIKQLEVYVSSSSGLVNLADTYNGTAFVDLAQRATAADSVEGQFKRLIVDVDYSANNELGTIRMNSSAQDDDIIAVAYSLGAADGAPYDSVGSVGYISAGVDDRVILKLIKDRGQSSGSPTWQLEFKNVYSLGGININPEGFDVKIFDSKADAGRTDRLGNETFLKIFGLDRFNNSDQQGPPDDLIDAFNYNLVKLNLGELHFPALLPFAYSSVEGVATSDTAMLEIYTDELEDLDGDFVFDPGEDLNGNTKWDVPDHYYDPLKPSSGRFEIEVQQSSVGASVYNLGFNMVRGSETVKINGQTLVEGKDNDYTIDVFSNTLTINHMENYVNPDVTIEYETNELVAFDKKVMMGARAQMDLGESSFLGVTGLYYNQSIIDERVDVGSEPIRNVLWDVNGRLKRDTPMLTRLVDRLPFIETDAVSSFNLEGEIAQVRPNPNPLGAGYVDDFEAAKRVSSPSLQYRQWNQSAPPVSRRLHHRRKMSWWNPYQDKSVQDIWPERETSIRADNLTTTILVLDAFFTRYGEAPTDSMWAGITYPLLPGEYDQSQTKFFEIWLNGNQGRLHIDIGDISEDINENGRVDTEDEPLPGAVEGNGLLDDGEDIGIDGCADADEDGNGGCFLIDDDGDKRTDEETFNNIDDDGDGRIDEDLGTRPILANESDPNGDNWKNSSSNFSNDFINGTEGNSETADGSRPDTEDLNGTGSYRPDVRNDYFTASFSLDPTHADTSFVGGSTFNDEGPTGWRLFRIPLADFQRRGTSTVKWDNVKNLRFWIDSLAEASTNGSFNPQIQIAQIEFVGNEWEEIGIAHIDSSNFTKVDSTLNLAVTVVNNEDNSDYQSPPGVEGAYDRLNGIRLREQSLSLDFRKRGLPPRTKAAVSKEIVNRTNEATFLAYGNMEMFVYGDADDIGVPLMTIDSTYYQFWLRLGLGLTTGESYYELRKPLYPGWDKRNHFDIEMEDLAALKDLDLPDTTVFVDADTLPGYMLEDVLVVIRGDPSVDRIGRYTAGIINTHPTRTIYGRAFMDELRLTDVKKEKGIAMRLSGSLKLADLLTTTFNYNRVDADFHTVQQKIARGPATNETFQSNILLNPDQILPKSWGIRTPVSMNYSRTINSPKYIPGRDIVAGDIRSAPEEVQRRSESVAVKVSFSKSARSRFWLIRQTLDRITGGVTYQVNDQSTKDIKSLDKQNITTNLNYPIKFSDENYIKPFGILEVIPWLGAKLKDTRIYYTPSTIQVSGTVTEEIAQQVNRAQIDSTIKRYNFNLKRSASAKYRLTDNIDFDYSHSANSSMVDLRDQKLEALQQFNTGDDMQISEQYSARFGPQIFSWLKPNVTYQSQYQWNKVNPINEPLRGANIAVNARVTTGLSLSPTTIVESFYKPKGTTAARRRRPPRRVAPKPEQDAKPSEVKNKKLEAIFKLLHAGSQKILPITLNHSLTSRVGDFAVRGQPGVRYRLGLEKSASLMTDSLTTAGVDRSSTSSSTDFSWKSGISLSKSTNLNFSNTRRRSKSRTTSTESESTTRSFLITSEDGKIGLPMVDWNIRLAGLEKLPILRLAPWTVSLEHSYTGSHVTNRQNQNNPVNNYKRSFQPLLGLTISFKNGISANARYSDQLSLDIKDSGDRKGTANQFSSSINYQRRGGFTIPIPFFGDFKLDNTVNFSFTMEKAGSVTYVRKGVSNEFSAFEFNKSLSIKPYITYTFSKNVNGSFRFGYTERENHITGKTITRDIGFDVNMAIRGS